MAGFPEWSQPRKSVRSHAYNTSENSWSVFKTEHTTQRHAPQGGLECFLLRAWGQRPNLPRVHGHSRGARACGKKGYPLGSSAGRAGPSLGGAKQGLPLSLLHWLLLPSSLSCASRFCRILSRKGNPWGQASPAQEIRRPSCN